MRPSFPPSVLVQSSGGGASPAATTRAQAGYDAGPGSTTAGRSKLAASGGSHAVSSLPSTVLLSAGYPLSRCPSEFVAPGVHAIQATETPVPAAATHAMEAFSSAAL